MSLKSIVVTILAIGCSWLFAELTNCNKMIRVTLGTLLILCLLCVALFSVELALIDCTGRYGAATHDLVRSLIATIESHGVLPTLRELRSLESSYCFQCFECSPCESYDLSVRQSVERLEAHLRLEPLECRVVPN